MQNRVLSIQEIPQAHWRALTLFFSKTGLEDVLADFGTKLGPNYVGQYDCAKAISYAERWYLAFRESVLDFSRVFQCRGEDIHPLVDSGVCVRYRGMADYFCVSGKFLEQLVAAESIQKFLGQDGWLEFLAVLCWHYYRKVFSKLKLEWSDGMTNERITAMIVKEEAFRSDYAAAYATELVRGHTKQEAVAIARASLTRSASDFPPGGQMIAGWIIAAYIGVPVDPRLSEFIPAVGNEAAGGPSRWETLGV